MNNIWIMTWYTLREAMARKVFISFFIISALVLIFMLVIFGSNSTIDIVSGMKNAKLNMPMDQIVSQLELLIISPLTGLCILLSIFASSSFIPIMLEKGNIDLLLSKPVSRDQLLLGKYFGGLLVVLLNIAFLVIGVWLIIAVKFSFWNLSFLWTIILMTFTFAMLYSLIVLTSVITKGSTFGMMIAYLVYLILSPVLHLAVNNMDMFTSSSFVKGLIKVFYYIVPQTAEVSGTITRNLAIGSPVETYRPIWISLIFLVLTMGIAISIFRKKDF